MESGMVTLKKGKETRKQTLRALTPVLWLPESMSTASRKGEEGAQVVAGRREH